MEKINLKPLNVPSDWTIKWNHFVDLEPDNDSPIDDVWTHFDEDISFFTNGEYFIDLGFYGGSYLENRSGFFRLVVVEGDFHQGNLYENFICRSTDQIKNKIENYLTLISSGEIKTLKSLKFGKDTSINDYLFSAVEGVQKTWTDNDYEK